MSAPVKNGRAFVCVLNEQGECLLLQAYKKKKGNHCQLPGGRLDPGEQPLQAARRELKEETDLDFPEDQFVFQGTIKNRSFFLVKSQGSPQISLSKEHVGWKWENPTVAVQELKKHSGGVPSDAVNQFLLGTK